MAAGREPDDGEEVRDDRAWRSRVGERERGSARTGVLGGHGGSPT
jgi:hypothetical protein